MMYVSEIVMLHTLTLFSAVCELYLSKTGRKKVISSKIYRNIPINHFHELPSSHKISQRHSQDWHSQSPRVQLAVCYRTQWRPLT